jgi:hypothetical protein
VAYSSCWGSLGAGPVFTRLCVLRSQLRVVRPQRHILSFQGGQARQYPSRSAYPYRRSTTRKYRAASPIVDSPREPWGKKNVRLIQPHLGRFRQRLHSEGNKGSIGHVWQTSRKAEEVVGLKITLRGIRPSIWRRLEVPSRLSLGGLHDAIQAARWDGKATTSMCSMSRHAAVGTLARLMTLQTVANRRRCAESGCQALHLHLRLRR